MVGKIKTIIDSQKKIIQLALDLGVNRIGFADLSSTGQNLTDRFPMGIVLIIPMDSRIVFGEEESRFFCHQVEQREELESIKNVLGRQLSADGYAWYSVGNDNDPTSFAAESSHKMVANLAGMGWIGKSSLFVTPDFGPRVRLTSLLTDAPFEPSVPMLDAKNGCEDCHLCVDACPVKAIRGNAWKPGMSRDDLLHANRCNKYRQNVMPSLGRSYRCSFCLTACPFGERL